MNKKQLRAECSRLMDCVKNPPHGWNARTIGAYIYREKITFFVIYVGQSVPEPVYNRSFSAVIKWTNEEEWPTIRRMHDEVCEWVRENRKFLSLPVKYEYYYVYGGFSNRYTIIAVPEGYTMDQVRELANTREVERITRKEAAKLVRAYSNNRFIDDCTDSIGCYVKSEDKYTDDQRKYCAEHPNVYMSSGDKIGYEAIGI